MTPLNARQKAFVQGLDEKGPSSRWHDWKWHIRHSIRDVKTFEKLLGITFTDDQRMAYEATAEQFPISITPYYLSLIIYPLLKRMIMRMTLSLDSVFLQRVRWTF